MFESVTEAVLGDVPIRIKVLRTAEAQAMGFMNQPEPENGSGLFLFITPLDRFPSGCGEEISLSKESEYFIEAFNVKEI